MIRQPSRPAGFTMLELLLAAVITFAMVLFLHVIFRSVSGTVSLGVATSDIIRANAEATVQLSADAEAMVGPLAQGFLLIIQKRVTNVVLRPGESPVSALRSDQVVWIRTVGGAAGPGPATPGSAGSYELPATSATHARVWYGHVLRTDDTGLSASELGAAGNNAIALNWILGRQLLFLGGSPLPAVHINSAPPFPGWSVTGYPAGPSIPADRWYKGLSDIFDSNLARINQYFSGTTVPPVAGAGYPQGPYQFSYGSQRLWCNPRSSQSAGLPTWRIAQMHPHFISNVSELRIDFAGSYDGLVPGVPVDVISGGIKWYGHFYNNPTEGHWSGGPYNPAEVVTYRVPTGGLKGLIPVGLVPDIPPRGLYEIQPMIHADAAFTFRPLSADWPRMIRIHYRVHDPQGMLTDRDGRPGKIFERIIRVAG